MALGLAVLATHVPLDRLNRYLFPRPALDFAIEAGLVVMTAIILTFRVSPRPSGKRWLAAAVAVLVAMQQLMMAFGLSRDDPKRHASVSRDGLLRREVLVRRQSQTMVFA